MPDYIISVRIKDDASYDERYDGFIDAISSAVATGYWSEMTSMWFIEADLEIGALGKAISKPLEASKDKLLIREIGRKNTRYFGAIDDVGVLQSFMPEAKNLP